MPPLQLQHQSSIATGIVILGDACCFIKDGTDGAEFEAPPLNETSLGKFTGSQESRLDGVYSLLETLPADLVQLEGVVASELRHGRLLSCHEQEWRGRAQEWKQQADENDKEIRQLRDEQEAAVLEGDEAKQSWLQGQMKLLEASRTDLEKGRMEKLAHAMAYRKAEKDVTEHAKIKPTGYKLPAISAWTPSSDAYVVRDSKNGRTVALAFLCEFSREVADAPDEPTSPPRTIRMRLKAPSEDDHVWLTSTCDLLIDKACATDEQLRQAVGERVLAYLKEGRHIKVKDAAALDDQCITYGENVSLETDSAEFFEVDVRVDPPGEKGGASTGDEEPEAHGPSAKQMEVAGRLLARMKRALALGLNCAESESLSNFYDLKFLILVPTFSTLQQQTADRVRDEGLLRIRSDGSKEIGGGDVII